MNTNFDPITRKMTSVLSYWTTGYGKDFDDMQYTLNMQRPVYDHFPQLVALPISIPVVVQSPPTIAHIKHAKPISESKHVSVKPDSDSKQKIQQLSELISGGENEYLRLVRMICTKFPTSDYIDKLKTKFKTDKMTNLAVNLATGYSVKLDIPKYVYYDSVFGFGKLAICVDFDLDHSLVFHWFDLALKNGHFSIFAGNKSTKRKRN
jgi:hypothetical protein